MATYVKLSDLLNTTAGMTVLRNNVGQDDGVDTVTGVDWFVFNGVAAKKLYVSGNSFVGFGSSSEHLKVCRRDGKMWYLYRQEGYIGATRFLKIRWEGYTYYSSTSSSYALKWELFLFDDGGLFLNLITVPSESNYMGTSALTCGSNTYAYTVNVSTPSQHSFIPQGNNQFVVTTDLYPVITNRVPYGECEFVIDAIRAATDVKESYIYWLADTPPGTTIRVLTALSEGAYAECENDGSIQGVSVGDDLSNETLRVKIEMSTNDTTITPILYYLVIQVINVEDDRAIVLEFAPGNLNSIQRAAGDIIVEYDGSGTLIGKGGPVLAFRRAFTPEGLDPKNNPHDAERIALDVSVDGVLKKIRYTDTSEVERISISDVTVIGALIHIDDI